MALAVSVAFSCAISSPTLALSFALCNPSRNDNLVIPSTQAMPMIADNKIPPTSPTKFLNRDPSKPPTTPPFSVSVVVLSSSPLFTFHSTSCTNTTNNTPVYSSPFLVIVASDPLYNQHQPL